MLEEIKNQKYQKYLENLQLKYSKLTDLFQSNQEVNQEKLMKTKEA